MRRHAGVVIAMLALSATATAALAQERAIVRRTLIGDRGQQARLLRAQNKVVSQSSIFTLGTAIGMTIYSDDPSTYQLRDRTVVLDEERSKVLPSVYALPSIALFRVGKIPISALLPFDLGTVGAALEGGFGLSGGVNVLSTAEVGIAAFVVWNSVYRLTNAQKQSLANGTALPAGAVTEFRKSARPQFSLSLYITPELAPKRTR